MSLTRELIAVLLTAAFAATLFTCDARSYGQQYKSYFDYSVTSLAQINV